MHPFDIKTVLFAKHAQHVVLIHFPIALFIIGVFFDFLAQWKKDRVLAAAAYYNMLVAAIATLPVVVTGLVAWQWELEGQKLKGILLMHLVLGCVSSALICLVWFIHRSARRKHDAILPGYRLPLEAVAVFVVGLTGHLGGFLSGVNGPG
ncbi:MAG TPA: DUF2231 domain-containing protein [Candidatus Acidoferrum sp.]|jgi:uncharacterized membrane protein|nr:DUF2231 domain-containing protein [Candidatus Acidoferrum sp.]